MKQKGFIIVIAIALAILGYGAYEYYSRPDGSTVERREELLRDTPKGAEWNISQEQELEDYLLSSIYCDSKSGIAVFEPIGDGKYKLISREWRNSEEIIVSGLPINGEWYDLIWFNGAKTNYAEITYSVSGIENEPILFDTGDMKIICSKAPAKEYTLTVKYYDDDGNVYE